MRLLYTLLFYLILPFIFLRLWWRSRHAPLYRKRWAERLGFCPHRLDQCILVHAVSLGETIAASPLIKALKEKYPNIPLLITNMTPTGSERVKKLFGDTVFNTYLPYDLPGPIARFLARVKPVVVVVMETELWPNLFSACKKRNIPIIVTNARLSERSANAYQYVAPFMRDVLSAITCLAAQAEPDAERFIALGMPRDRVKITGSLKFDLELARDLPSKSAALRDTLGRERLIWIAASTHPGEDEIVLSAHKKIREKISDALLILVPRHLERFDAVAADVVAHGFSIARRSKNENCDQNTAVYLGDTMGEMMLMYSVCDVACVCGSFVSVGGHNVIEPAALQKPVITGPQLFNFSEISNLLITAGGMLTVENQDQLAKMVLQLFENENQRKDMGEKAFQVVEKNRGALRRQLELIVF